MKRPLLLAGVFLMLLFAVFASGAIAEPAAFDPAPRDARGRFSNPEGVLSHGSFGVRMGFSLRRIGNAFYVRPGAPERVENDGAFLRENAKHSVPTVTWIGHATLLVQMDHIAFLTDPTWSDTASPVAFAGPRRFVVPGVALEDLPEIDFVVVSHNHYDHLDLGTLERLAAMNPRTRFFVPLGNGSLLRDHDVENVVELDWGESREYRGVRIHCLPAQHWSKRSLTDDNRALWSSWAVVGKERRFYHAGDTGYWDGFARIGAALGPFDLVAVPIGAYEPASMMEASHTNPEQALQAALDLRAERAVGMHFGTFDLSDEPLDEPPRRFRAAAVGTPLEAGGAFVMKVGETRDF